MNVNRIIGQYHGQNEGPMLVFVAGIHGNEITGVQALQQVFEALESEKPNIKGSIIGLAGNVKALASEVRYIDHDLNRVWLSEENDSKVSEHNEREELSKVLGKIISSQQENVFLFDLHTTSSESTPFIMMSDTLRNRELSKFVGVPIVLGLLEHLMGMFIDATSRCGFPTVLFQGGTKGGKDTKLNHMGLIWKMLKCKCDFDETTIAESKLAISQLDKFLVKDKNHLFHEILHSHRVRNEADFEMKSGYVNFQDVNKNEVVASSNGKKLKALYSGQIFMPLYQKQGAEGFYVIKNIADKWIRLSRKFRLFSYHDKLHWLLGVKKVGSNPLTYRIDEQVTFLWALEIFHLLGYIKVRQDGPVLFMARRENASQPATTQEAIRDFTAKAYLRSELKKLKAEWKVPFSKRNSG